ncbi:MAG: hypothetical protein ACP5XB_07430 [Isosphaeraceae bacterium]
MMEGFNVMDDQPMNLEWARSTDHSRRSETIGWLLMVGLAFLVFELTADSSLAVVVGCLKFGTPDLKVARWLRRADPDRVRGRTCSWFYVTLAVVRVGFTAFFLMGVLFAVAGAGNPQGQIGRQTISALIVLLACFTGAAIASWVAVASALLGGVRVWMDATVKSAVQSGCWPPVVPQQSGRAVLGPGLIVAYAFFTGWLALISVLLIPVMLIFRVSNLMLISAFVLEMLCAFLGMVLARRAIRRIEANNPWECYGDSPPCPDDTGQPVDESN